MMLMTTTLFAALSFQSAEWFQTLLNLSFKGAVILTVAVLLNLAFRRESAAARHLVWSVALTGLLALPVLSPLAGWLIPGWQLPLLPAINEAASLQGRVVAPVTDALRLIRKAALPGDSAVTKTIPATTHFSEKADSSMTELARLMPPDLDDSARDGVGSVSVRPTEARPVRWAAIVLLIWLAGFVAVAFRLIAGIISIWLLTRKAKTVAADDWQTLLTDISARLGLRRQIRLRKSGQVAVPMTWGILRPTVLLSADADEWSNEWREVVLLHELAHIKRLDSLTQLIASLVCALYWFNPLVWIAAHKLRIERELACDDHVLHLGTRASDYAGCLVEIARSVGKVRYASAVAVGMACSQLESRVRAILDPAIHHRLLNRRAALLVSLLIGCLLIPLAALQPWASPTSQQEKKQTSKTASPLDTPQPKDKQRERSREAVIAEPAIESTAALAEIQALSEAAAALAQDDLPSRTREVELLVKELQAKAAAISGTPVAIAPAIAAMLDQELAQAPQAAVSIAGRAALAPAAEAHGVTIAGTPAAAKAAIEAQLAMAADMAADAAASQEPGKENSSALTVDNLVRMKIANVTPEYIEAIRRQGYDNLSIKELVNLKMQGINEEFIRETKNWSSEKLTVRELVNLKIAGVTADYVRQMKQTGYDVPIQKLARMRMFGITPEYVDAMRKAGYDKLTADELVGLKMHGVNGDYVRQMREQGFTNLTAGQLQRLKMHGVTETYLKEMREAGFDKLSADELIRLKMHGVDGDYIKKMRAAGLKNISANDALKLKIHGIDKILLRN